MSLNPPCHSPGLQYWHTRSRGATHVVAAVQHHTSQNSSTPSPPNTQLLFSTLHGPSHNNNQHQLATLITQCSLDRWPRFVQQAASWGGPVSVAVYIPAPQHSSTSAVCLELLQDRAAAHAAAHPDQSLRVSVLFAQHFAREGMSVLQQLLECTGGTTLDHPLLQCSTASAAAAASSIASTRSTSSNTSANINTSSRRSSIPYEQLYPINALRNLAVHHAATPLVMSADADFIFSTGLQQMLHGPSPYHSLAPQAPAPAAPAAPAPAITPLAAQDAAVPAAEPASAGARVGETEQATATTSSLVQQLLELSEQQQQVMLMLPAFQLTGRQGQQQQQQQQQQAQQQTEQQQQQQQHEQGGIVPDSVALQVPSTKKELVEALKAGTVQQFDCGVFSPTQQPLQLEAWLSAEQPLDVTYTDMFEVHCGIAVKQQLPPYSEAFRGYGLNKQQHAWHAAALGYKFKALPHAFVVTAPHKRSPSWRPAAGTAADAQHLARIAAVYDTFKQQITAASR